MPSETHEGTIEITFCGSTVELDFKVDYDYTPEETARRDRNGDWIGIPWSAEVQLGKVMARTRRTIGGVTATVGEWFELPTWAYDTGALKDEILEQYETAA